MADDMGRACSRNGVERNSYRVFMGTAEGKSPLGLPKSKRILQWILEVMDGAVKTGLIWLRIAISGGL
jgi:hypothetical protein